MDVNLFDLSCQSTIEDKASSMSGLEVRVPLSKCDTALDMNTTSLGLRWLVYKLGDLLGRGGDHTA